MKLIKKIGKENIAMFKSHIRILWRWKKKKYFRGCLFHGLKNYSWEQHTRKYKDGSFIHVYLKKKILFDTLLDIPRKIGRFF